MDKTKIAICIGDAEYETRFVKCVMNHYKDSYEIHVFRDILSIKQKKEEEGGQRKKFHIVVTDEKETDSFCNLEETVYLVLQEYAAGQKEIQLEKNVQEHVFYTEKYQEVYKIMEVLEQIIAQNSAHKMCYAEDTNTQLIGVFSMEKESMQMPFTALLAEVLGDRNRVLVFDLQPFSGFSTEINVEENALGMEDLMAVAMTEVYTGNRLAASIGHEQKWDYVFPVRNVQCLAEVDVEVYRKMVRILQKERGYQYVILNFGATFSGMLELMEDCRFVYFLTEGKEEYSWREASFFQELRQYKKEEVLHRLIRTEVPVQILKEKTWRNLAKVWLWGELGDHIRELNWVE